MTDTINNYYISTGLDKVLEGLIEQRGKIYASLRDAVNTAKNPYIITGEGGQRTDENQNLHDQRVRHYEEMLAGIDKRIDEISEKASNLPITINN